MLTFQLCYSTCSANTDKTAPELLNTEIGCVCRYNKQNPCSVFDSGSSVLFQRQFRYPLSVFLSQQRDVGPL